jgi:two-component system, LytTR family, sensor kinase
LISLRANFPTVDARLRIKRAVLAICFWTAVALVFVVPKLSQSHDWWETVQSSLAMWWPWGLLTPLITTLDRYLTFPNRRFPFRIVGHLILGPIFSVIYVYLSAGLAAIMEIGTWSQVMGGKLLTMAWQEMFWSLLVYSLIVGVWQAYQSQQRYVSAEIRMQRLERNFTEARLNSLRMQLDPHFLFNALNTISAHAEHEPRLARKMIEHLGDLLRLSLGSQSRAVVTLAEELAFLDHYLAIQRIRFGDRLRVQIDVATRLAHALVPSLFLQPLVENAIRHGLAPRSRGGTITITVAASNDTLRVDIIDDGVGLPTMWPPETTVGLGLTVTRERIAGLFTPGSSHFSIRRRAEGGTSVEIALPLRFSENIDDRPLP